MKVKSVSTLLVAAAVVLFPSGLPAAAQTYTLDVTVEPADSGAYDVVPNQDTYAAGTVVTVTAAPLPGFEFVGWEGDIATTDSQLIFVVTADTVLTALFQATNEGPTEFVVLVVSEPQEGGHIRLQPAQTMYTSGTLVTLIAVPAEGHVFATWSVDVSTDVDLTLSQITLSVNEDLEITANFEAAAEVRPDGDTRRSAACGTLGLFFWPSAAVGLALVRHRLTGR